MSPRPRQSPLSWLGRPEEGMTLIEVVVAALVLALAALATFGVLVAATRNAQRGQATQVALDKAQEELEKLHALGYAELALSSAPEPSANPDDPNSRVSGGSFYVKREPLSEPATMVVHGGSLYGTDETIEAPGVYPGPVPFRSGNVSGKLYRYVVWRNDAACPESDVGAEDFCPGGQDYKQIIVAVKLDKPVAQSAETSYLEVQSQVSNPGVIAQSSTGGDDSGGGSGGLGTHKAVTAQQFFLSDTPCAASGPTVRQPIAGDHLLHNTLGTCASGLQAGSDTLGAPDALLLGAPPDPDPVDESNPPLYDYSSDSYLELVPNTDKGLQLLRDDTSGCHYVPTSTVHPQAKVHRWVTDPFASDFKLNGKITLEFYSRTLNEGSYPATLCVFLFEREETEGEEPKGEDRLFETQVTGARYWTYSSQENELWPRNGWTKLRLPMELGGMPKEIPAGNRLGVALSVDAANTPPESIRIMYDHPNFPTRLEVDTTTPIEGG